LVIKILDPDPQLEKMLDPGPHSINADPKACLISRFWMKCSDSQETVPVSESEIGQIKKKIKGTF
jgi:hypothetical protein